VLFPLVAFVNNLLRPIDPINQNVQGALSDDAVWRLSRTSGRRAACAAGWTARIGWSGPARTAWLKAIAAGFRCRPVWGHIVAADRLQLVSERLVTRYSGSRFHRYKTIFKTVVLEEWGLIRNRAEKQPKPTCK